jgi:hypothetical protein
LFTFAAIVGATDIDPFVLNIAAGGVAPFSDKVGIKSRWLSDRRLPEMPSCCSRLTASPYDWSCRERMYQNWADQLCVDQHAGVEQTLWVECALRRS